MTTESDELIQQCIQICLEHNKASCPLLQKHLKIGYVRASRILEHLESIGIVGPRVATTNRPGEFLARTIVKPMPKNCASCKHWHIQQSSDAGGVCRHRSPIAGPTSEAVWPWTMANNVCGDHQFKLPTP